MTVNFKSANIIQSFKLLKGNTRTSVIFEPLWGIPFVLYNFYLSLYMKSQGVTDQQIGFLISIGFIAGSLFSLFGGIITDALGRKKTTLIFDLISWPGAILVYFISNNFWWFALAQIINSSVRIVAVSWNLMVIEDADDPQRVAAFNILNIITISMGIITPVAGLLVKMLGVADAERIFLAFAAVSMTIMMLGRNHFYTETRVGQKILDEHSRKKFRDHFKKGLYRSTFAALGAKPEIIMILCILLLFNIYLPIGTFSSLYFAPYMTEVLGIDKAAVSILGGVNSGMMLIIFVFVTPVISRFNKLKNMMIGLAIQAISLFLFTVLPAGNLLLTILCIAVFAVGFGIFRPFIDAILAEATEGNERAGIYSLLHTSICILNAIVGLVSGYLYVLNPRLLYFVSIGILLCCITLISLLSKKKTPASGMQAGNDAKNTA